VLAEAATQVAADDFDDGGISNRSFEQIEADGLEAVRSQR
jgi:hypothetical protein